MLFLVKVILTLWVFSVRGQERECIVPDIEQNLIVQPQKEKYVVGDVLKFSCRNRLHFLLGPDSLQCYHFGWSPNPPTCKETICSSPPSYGNAILIGWKKKSYRSGEQVTYRCPDYYQMDGSHVVQCWDGIWVGTPICKDLSCGSPPPVLNAFIPGEKPRYRHGDTARYQCRHRLGLFRNAVVTCLSGKWTDPPECKDSTGKCGSPPVIDNGDITTNPKRVYAPGSSVEYQCQAFHELEGNRRITCYDGEWSEPPKCLDFSSGSPPEEKPNPFIPDKKQPICSSPPSYGNAILIGWKKKSYRSGEQVTYRCPDYYQMDGSNAVQCRDGIWIGRPTCKDVSCGSPPPVQNAFIPGEKRRYRHGDTARYQCRHALDLFGNAVVTCLSGKWTDPPECMETICSSPPSYGNAILIGQLKSLYRSGEQVIYRCPDYYQMDGSHFVECRGGMWIGTPTCKDLSCGSPPPVQNAVIPDEKPRYRPGDTARYECTNSLGLLGNAVVTCLRGKWTDPPECKDSTGKCGPPPVIDNGDITTYPSPLYAPRASVEYQCQAYYVLEGNRRITCRDGEWSEPPKCLESTGKCGPPPVIDNGDITTYPSPLYAPGSSVEYQCQAYYVLEGNRRITCRDGQWSEPPKCLDSTGKCGPPPVIDNGDITTYPSPLYAPWSSVEYQCQAYYVLEGNRRITCRDGEWSEPPKCLDPCVISEEVMEQHNIALKWSHEKKLYSRTNDYTEFRCRRGYHKVSPASAFRAQCREGKVEYPICA